MNKEKCDVEYQYYSSLSLTCQERSTSSKLLKIYFRFMQRERQLENQKRSFCGDSSEKYET